jgi:hypothetical protein
MISMFQFIFFINISKVSDISENLTFSKLNRSINTYIKCLTLKSSCKINNFFFLLSLSLSSLSPLPLLPEVSLPLTLTSSLSPLSFPLFFEFVTPLNIWPNQAFFLNYQSIHLYLQSRIQTLPYLKEYNPHHLR